MREGLKQCRQAYTTQQTKKLRTHKQIVHLSKAENNIGLYALFNLWLGVNWCGGGGGYWIVHFLLLLHIMVFLLPRTCEGDERLCMPTFQPCSVANGPKILPLISNGLTKMKV
jgi:hypothetical protein